MYRCIRSFTSVGAPPLKISKFTPYELSRVVLRAVRENHSDVRFWRAVSVRAAQLADTLQPWDISVIVHSLGRMKYRDRTLLARLATAVTPQLGAMSMGDLARLLSGFARVEVRNDLLFDLASREIGRKLPAAASLAELAHVMHAYSQLNYEHPLLFAAVAKRASIILPIAETPAREIAKLVHAFSRAGVDNPKLFALMSSEVCRRIEEFPVGALATVANSYAKSGLVRTNQFLFEQILDESFRRRAEFDNDPVSTALLLSAIAKAKEVSSRSALVMDYLVSDMSKKGIAKFDLHAVVTVANSVGVYHSLVGAGTPSKELTMLFQLIGDRVATLADDLQPRQIALLARAFGAVGARHGPLLFNLPKHVEEMLGDFSLVEMAMIMQGYAALAIRNDTLLNCAPGRLIELLEESSTGSHGGSAITGGDDEIFALSVRSDAGPPMDDRTIAKAMVDILEAYAVLMVNEKALLSKLIVAIDERKEWLTEPQLLTAIPKSVNVLGLKCPDGLAALITSTPPLVNLDERSKEALIEFNERYRHTHQLSY